jgi:hypothetical protein
MIRDRPGCATPASFAGAIAAVRARLNKGPFLMKIRGPVSAIIDIGDALQEGLGEGPEFALATSRLKIGGTRMRRAAFWGGSGIASEK